MGSLELSEEARILTIDDEYVLRQSIVAYLEDSGFTVYEGENGRHGMEVFREEKPDLVLTDLQMPEMGGLEVLAAITQESPETPVIVVSGAGGMNDVIEALRLGAWDYLTKPVTDLAVLEHAVCKSLERGRLIKENKLYREQIKKNLEVLEEDQIAGRSVQMRLLPEQGMELSDYVFLHSVTPSLYLSGDFIDYFRIDDKHLGFYIADVSGHGASSAFITVLLKSIINQVLARFQVQSDPMILEPNSLMGKLSAEIHSAKLGKYLTMVYGYIDLTTNEYHYSVGGHYPNPIYVKDGQGKYLDGQGFPVGIMPKVEYQNLSMPMEENSYLMMFSDGVMEIIPDETMEEKESRLLNMVVECNGEVDKMLEALGIKDTDENEELPDDITFLIVKRK